MLSVIDGSWVPNEDDESRNLSAGFGATINIINGGLECTVPEGGTEDQRAENRIGYYEKFAEALGYSIDAATDETSCVGMKRFSAQGGGALPIYWDTDWGWDGERGGPSYRCKLVEYQTPYSALTETGYRDCVTDMFME